MTEKKPPPTLTQEQISAGWDNRGDLPESIDPHVPTGEQLYEEFLAERIQSQVARVAADCPQLARRLHRANWWGTIGFIIAGALLAVGVSFFFDRVSWTWILVSGMAAVTALLLSRYARNASIGSAMMIGAIAYQYPQETKPKKNRAIQNMGTGIALAKLDREIREQALSKDLSRAWKESADTVRRVKSSEDQD